jgi:hypothetical protein
MYFMLKLGKELKASSNEYEWINNI